jgi:hypothetical protein
LKKFIRYLLWALSGIAILLVLCVGAGWLYLKSHKAAVLSQVRGLIDRQIRADTRFDDFDINILETFPNPSVHFSNITIRDRLLKEDQRVFFKAEHLYATIPVWRLLTGKPSLGKITVVRGTAYIYSDSTGYSSTAIFRRSADVPKAKPYQLPDIDIRDSKLVVDKREKNKLFHFHIARLQCRVHHQDMQESLSVSLLVQIETMAFRNENGSFLENKEVSGNFSAQFNPASKVLQAEKINLQIDHQPFECSAKFFLGVVPAPFLLTLDTRGINFEQARSLLTPKVRHSLSGFTLDRPLDLSAVVDGTEDYSEPLLRIRITVSHSGVMTPFARFSDASFKGYFTNLVKNDQPRGDENSLLRFTSFYAEWEHIRIHSDTIKITNLKKPYLDCDLNAFMDLPGLNHLTENKDLALKKGTGKLSVVFRGPADNADSSMARQTISGWLELDSATIDYLPRNLRFSDATGRIRFAERDLTIDSLATHVGTSDLQMRGSVRNIFALVGDPAGKPSFECRLSSGQLNLADFTGFLHRKSSARTQESRGSLPVRRLSGILNALNDNDAHVQLKARQILYRKFMGSNLSAVLLLSGNEMKLQEVSLQHAGGLITMSGSLVNDPHSNPATLRVWINQVDVPRIFEAFSNFGQSAITAENLEGKMQAAVTVSGELSEKASLVPHSLKGLIDFRLQDGALKNFAPVQQIGSFVFKHKDLSDVRFAELKDRLEIDSTTIRFNRMDIRSTAITMFVEGTYDLVKGTDMSLQVPLSNLGNLKKDALNIDPAKGGKAGASIHLRLKTDADRKLKITWDPFKKALKNSRKKP